VRRTLTKELHRLGFADLARQLERIVEAEGTPEQAIGKPLQAVADDADPLDLPPLRLAR
jgi:hypothetical protein